MSNPTKKKVFLLISSNVDRLNVLSQYINFHYDKPTIYTAPNGNVGLLKMTNAVIDILVCDSQVNASDSINMIETVLASAQNPHMAIMIVGHPTDAEKFVDELVTGKIYFLDEDLPQNEFSQILAKALNFNSHAAPASFYLRYLANGDLLLNEGDKAEFVYILKSGRLQAFNEVNGEKVLLGFVEPGEFVGEMSYISNEPRSASIEAVSDAQLIEVPIGLVDKVLYKRPAWSKALLTTLSKRLKTANKSINR
jgi:CRP/FNR family transcriptional regulator, cyclic AMP receptor protein